jgi:hypothetical protein
MNGTSADKQRPRRSIRNALSILAGLACLVLRRQGWYITPVNRNAAFLLPQLMPPGLLVSQFPTGGPYAAMFIHCQADPEQARTWLQPFLNGLRLPTTDPVTGTCRQEE